MAAPVDFLSFVRFCFTSAWAVPTLSRLCPDSSYSCRYIPVDIPAPRRALCALSVARVDMCKTKYVRSVSRVCVCSMCECVKCMCVCVCVIIAYLCDTSAAAVAL